MSQKEERIAPNKMNIRLMIALIIMLLIGIIVRWAYIRKELSDTVNRYLPETEQTDTTGK